MMDVLQEFLTRRLVTIGSDDDRLIKVTAAKASLIQALVDNRQLSLGFTLAAIHPQVSEDDHAILAASHALQSEWQTYKGAFESEPISLYRAMLIAALREAWENDPRIAAVFVYLARNILPEADLGAEAPIWSALFEDAQARLEKQAALEWNDGTVVSPKLTAKLPELHLAVAMSKPDVKALTKSFEAASGPTDTEGAVIEDGNPHWPNEGQNWSYEFAPLAAGAVTSAIEKLKLTISPADLGPSLKVLTDAVEAYGASLSKSLNGAIAGVSRRNKLLWWKEAMFSTSLERSYRDMPPETAALAMAIDLEPELPIYHPAAVEYFLKEAVREQEAKQKPAKLGAWIAKAKHQALVDKLRDRLDGSALGTTTINLAIRDLLSDAEPLAASEREISGGEFAVRILRELQAILAASSES